MPLAFRVVLLAHSELSGLTAPERVPRHKHFGELTEAVEDEFAWVSSNVDHPIEMFEGNHRSVHVNPSVFDEQCETNKVAFGRRVRQQFSSFKSVLYPLKQFCANVLRSVV